MWLEIALFVAVVAFILVEKLAPKYKAYVFLAYMISVSASLWITRDLPYGESIVLIYSLCILLPVIVTLLTWGWCAKLSKT